MSLNEKTNIIIVTVFYPPVISVASNRMFAFAKYADKEKFNIHVITLATGQINECDTYKQNIHVIRIKNPAFLKRAGFSRKTGFVLHKLKALYNRLLNFFIKDEYYSWVRRACVIAAGLMSGRDDNVLISSFPPVAAHKVPLALRKEGLPFVWIADMRDLMCGNSFHPFYMEKWLCRMQTIILEHADVILSVSSPIIEKLKKCSPGIKIYEIRNGYDFIPGSSVSYNNIFTITYTGSFYGKYKPDVFFHALSNLIRDGSLQDVRVRFIGVKNVFFIPAGLRKYVQLKGKISTNEAVEEMKKADALLLVLPENCYKGVYTGKLFEYLACMKPIIALVDKEDVAADLIRSCNAGFIAGSGNVNEAESAILDAWKLWKERKTLEYNTELISKHHRKEQVGRLQKIILELLNNSDEE